MLIPGVDFTTIGKVAKAYFECVNDNGGINGRPIKYIALHRAAQPGAGGRARPQADRERQGRRHRRQHELRRVRHELEVLQEQGLHRHRRRRAGRVLQHPVLRRGRTWARATATSARRRRSSGRASKKLVDRLAGHDLGVRGRRPALRSRRRPASRSRASRRICRSPTRPRSCSRCTSSPVTAAASYRLHARHGARRS